MDGHWREWHRSVVLPLLDPLSSETPPEHADLARLATDTDRPQEYVFASAHLPEVRGASDLLRRLNTEVMPRIITGTRPRFECILCAGGGSLLALVPNSIADNLMSDIEVLYPRHLTRRQC